MKRNKRLMGAALAAFLGLAPSGFGQDAPPQAKKHFSRKSTFRIPIQIEDREREDLKELRLFVRTPEGEWVRKESAPATHTAFSFRAERDGEYWFSIVTVDKAGKSNPPDPTHEEPGLIVVVDTQLPEIDVRPLSISTGQVYLQCRMVDANPDYSSVKIDFQAADGSWQPLEGLANAPGVVQLPSPRVLDGKVRVRAADKAGNTVEREIDLARMKVPGAFPIVRGAPTPPVQELPGVATKERVAVLPAPEGPMIAPPDGPYLPAEATPGAAPVVTLKPDTSAIGKLPLPGALVAPIPAKSNVLAPAPVAAPMSVPTSVAADPMIKGPSLGTEPPKADVAGKMLVNNTRCRIDFAVDPVPKGILQVEVWITADTGKSWRIAGISPEGKSPVMVEFPGEGKFGYSFVVKPTSGLAPPPPRAGDAPDGWVEIDTTKPVAELLGAALGEEKDTGLLLISWMAKDANLGAKPVSLFWAAQPAGPWQVIAERLDNSGNYRWPVPKGIGYEVHLRLEVTDKAGNVTRCDTPTPVQVEIFRPKVRVLNVAPARE